jgi:hypothetical protein
MTNRIPDPYQVTEWLFAALGLFFNAVIMILFWLFADIDDRLVNIYNLID